MIVSLNEVEILSLKACRGAGMSWGLAEEAAQAARWLAGCAWAWDQSLARLLAQRHGVSEPSLSHREIRGVIEGSPLCPIHAGAAIADLLEAGTSLTLHDVLEPIWLLPFAYRRVRAESSAVVSWPTGAIRIGAANPGIAGQELSGLQTGRLQWLRVELQPHDTQAQGVPNAALPNGISVNDVAWADLEGWAARTYVSASLQSRMAGAGAGLFDND